MSFKINKSMLFILTVLLVIIIIPASFANEFNDTQSLSDVEDASDDALAVEDATDDLNVDDGVIYVSPTAADDGQGTSNNPYTLSKAIENYNSTKNSHIFVKNGEYTFTNQITINKSINIIGESKDNVILNGNFESAIFKLTGTYPEACDYILSNLTFINGNQTKPTSTINGVPATALHVGYINSLSLSDCNFNNNEYGAVTFYGGSNEPIVTIDNCCFNGNSRIMDSSGGAVSGAAINIYGKYQVNITNSIFRNNRAESTYPSGSFKSFGGAIYAAGQTAGESDLVIDNCQFINNSADNGSAIDAYCAGNIYVLNSVFTNQTAPAICDKQDNSKTLVLYVKNNDFDDASAENIVIAGNVNLVSLDTNTRISGNDVGSLIWYDRVYVGEDQNYTVTLTDANKNPLSGKTINVTFTNYYGTFSLTNITDENGQAIFPLSNFAAGKYSVVAKFDGEVDWDAAETTNKILIADTHPNQIIITPNPVKMNEGESFIVTGTIIDEYLEPTRDYNNMAFHVEYTYYNERVHSIYGGQFINGSGFTFDLNDPSLITRQDPYVVIFTVDDDMSYYGSFSGNVTVDLSVDLPDVSDIDVIYVSNSGNDDTGNGSETNKLATVQKALLLNRALGGGKTIMVDEGTYEISNFHILENVTIIGVEGKTVFTQPSGKEGMFKMDYNESNIVFRGIIFRNGYTTPQPYSLLTIYGANIYVYVENCEFVNNTGLEGSSIAVSHKAYAFIDNCKFYDNKAILITSEGGAIEVFDAYASITNCEFINNTACDGGAIYANYASVVDIVNSTFINNTAVKTTLDVGGGGAIFARGMMNIYNCAFINNTADLYGGAIFVWAGQDDNINVERCYFEGNGAGKQTTQSAAKDIHIYQSYYFNFNLEYSVFAGGAGGPLVLNTADLEYSNITANNNYWGTNSANGNTNIDYDKWAIIVVESETTPVYEGSTVKINVQFMGKNADGTTYLLDKSMHDYTVGISNTIESNILDANEVTICDNIAQVNYNAVSTGSETVTAGNTNAQFKVIKSTKDNVNPNISIVPGENTVINIEVPNTLENNITINVNGTSYSKAAENGVVSLTIPTLPGIYPVSISYEGDVNYNEFTQTTSFTVDKFSSDVNVQAEDIYNGENAIINVKVSPVIAGTVTIMVDARVFTETLKDGIATFNVSGLYIKDYEDNVQLYTIYVKYNGNELYAESSNSTNMNVIRKPVEPVVPEKEKGYANIYVTPGANSKILIRVPYNLQNNVTVVVDNQEYSLVESEGRVNLTIPTDYEGTHTVSVSYAGDENVTDFSASTTFKVDDYTWFINENKYRSIYDAIEAANEGDIIKGTPGVYEIYQTVDVGHRYMPSEPWDVNKTVTVTSINSEPITFKGDSRRIFFVDVGSALTLKNIIFTGTNLTISDGAAVENMYGSSLTIENCTFKDLEASRGGALFVWGGAVIKDTKFINNRATLGGAIFVLGSFTTQGSFVLDNVEFIENTASSFGGALYYEGSSSYVGLINNSKFTDNTGNWRGGAIYLSYSNITIDNTEFKGNKAISEDYEVEVQDNVIYGPCGCIIDTSNAVVRNETVHIDAVGGAIYVSNYVNAFVFNSKFDDNSAEFGGALGLSNSITGVSTNGGPTVWTPHWTTLDNCSFTKNYAQYAGGAIFIGYTGVPYVNITDSTFDANAALDGAAIENDFGMLTIKGSEFKNHVSTGSLITAFGIVNYIEVYNAITDIDRSVFKNNNVDCDIYQDNEHTMLSLSNSIFDGDGTILVNRGQANLNNVTEINKKSNKNSTINYGTLNIENSTFASSNDNKSADVKISTSIKVSNIKMLYNSGKNLVATLVDINGKAIANAKVSFIINGKPYYRTTDSKGQAKFKVTLMPNTYTAKIKFEGNNKYLASGVASAKVVVKKLNTKITASKKTFKAKTKTKKYTITLKANGKAVKKVKVILKIKGKTFKAKTNAKGKATFNIKLTKKGKATATIKFAGNKIYSSATKKVKITIKK